MTSEEITKAIGKLGRVQRSVLRGLAEHGGWERGCGWVWDSQRGTEKIIERLVARGLVGRTPTNKPTPRAPWCYRLKPEVKAFHQYVDVAMRNRRALIDRAVESMTEDGKRNRSKRLVEEIGHALGLGVNDYSQEQFERAVKAVRKVTG